jgi:hypothetical protein
MNIRPKAGYCSVFELCEMAQSMIDEPLNASIRHEPPTVKLTLSVFVRTDYGGTTVTVWSTSKDVGTFVSAEDALVLIDRLQRQILEAKLLRPPTSLEDAVLKGLVRF